MKEYELIWEIFNKCPRNQMRDVFVEELELEDPEVYLNAVGKDLGETMGNIIAKSYSKILGYK